MMGFNGSGVLGRIASGFGSEVRVENEVSDIATGVSPVRTGSLHQKLLKHLYFSKLREIWSGS